MPSSNLFEEANESAVDLSLFSESSSADILSPSGSPEGAFTDPIVLSSELTLTEQELEFQLQEEYRTAETIVGTDGADILTGDNKDNVIIALDGNDSLLGLGGNDKLEGGRGKDSIQGGQGKDLILGEQGNDSLLGSKGNDILFGANGNDFLEGGEGRDIVLGGDGDDHARGGYGDDNVRGQEGDDLVAGGKGDDLVIGHGGDDSVTGNNGNDFLFGGSGKDTLVGGNGDDDLTGNQGHDVLIGSKGDDTLDGSEGDDTLRGDDYHLSAKQRGKDVFVLCQGEGHDLIRDFEIGKDKIALPEGLNFNKLTITQKGHNTILGVKATKESFATLANVNGHYLTNHDFINGFCDDEPPVDDTKPKIRASLANDTGMDDTDNLTSEPTIRGRVTDDGEIAKVKASFRLGNTKYFTDITSYLNPNGSFTLNRKQLKRINRNHPLQDGDYTLNLIATDKAGNTSSLFPVEFTLDTTPPRIHLNDLGNNDTIDDESLLAGTVNEDMVMLTYRFNNGAEIDVPLNGRGFNQAFDLTGIAPGQNHLTLTATDKAGNVRHKRLSLIVEIDPIDNIPPDVSAALSNDTGMDDADGITIDPSISGLVTDDGDIASVKASFDVDIADFQDITPQLNPDGSFTLNRQQLESINDGQLLSDGEYTLNLIATDTAGNESEVFPVSFTLDTTPPGLDVTQPLENTFLNTDSQLIGMVDEDMVMLTYRFNDGEEIDVSLSGDNNFNQSLDLSGLPEGEKSLVLTAIDKAGNITEKTITVIIGNEDITAPVITADLDNDSGIDATDNITNNPQVEGNITDDSAIASAKAGLNTTDPSSLLDVTDILQPDGSFILDEATLASLNNNEPLADGDYSISLMATDAANNGSDIFTVSYTLDTTPPLVNAIMPAPGSQIVSGMQLTGMVNENVTSFTYRIGDGSDITISPNEVGEFQQVLDLAGIDPGQQTITLTATDIAGNTSTNTVEVEVIEDDGTVPMVNAELANDTGDSNSDGITLDPTIDGQIVSTQDVTSLMGRLNGSGFVDLTGALNDDNTFTLSLEELDLLSEGNLPDGDYEIEVKATDSLSRESTIFSVNFTLDRTEPPISFDLAPESDTGTLNDLQTTERIVTLVGQTEPGLTVVLVETQQETTADEDGNFSFADVPLSAAGTAPFTVVTQDVAGNQGRATNDIAKEGINGAPTITSTPNETFDTSQNDTYTYQVTATDPDNDTLSYTLLNAPTGAEIDENGLLTFAPETPQATYDFTVEASDGRGGTDIQNFTVSLVGLDPGIIQGTKFNDLNANGIRDVGFTPTEGSAVTVTSSSNGILLSNEEVDLQVRGGLANNGLVPSGGYYEYTDIETAERITWSVDPLLVFEDGSTSVLSNASTGGFGAPELVNDNTARNTVATNGVDVQADTELIGTNAKTTFTFTGDDLDGTTFVFYAENDIFGVGDTADFSGSIQGDDLALFMYDTSEGGLSNRLTAQTISGAELTQFSSGVWTGFGTQLENGNLSVLSSDGSNFAKSGDLGLAYAFELSGTEASLVINYDSDPQPPEPGLADWTIYLDDNNNAQLDDGEISTTTDANGNYQFNDLAPSTYTVREVQQPGFIQTSEPEAYELTITDGEEFTNIDFGNQEIDVENNAPEFTSNPITNFLSAIPGTPIGEVDPSIIRLNVDDSIQDIVSYTVPDPGTGSGFGGADIVFVVDESGSMSGEQAWLTDTVLDLDAALQARGIDDNRYSIIGFTDSVRNLTLQNQPEISVYGLGNKLVDTQQPGADLTTFTLPGNGDYTFVLDGIENNPLDYDLFVEIENSISITPEDFDEIYTQTINIDEEQTFTFEASAGTKVYFDDIFSDSTRIIGNLTAPNGEIVIRNTRSDRDSSTTFTLLETGTYTFAFNGGTDGGDYSFRLLDLTSAPILQIDTPISDTLDLLTGSQGFKIEGQAGQRLYFDTTTASTFNDWSVYDAENNLIIGRNLRTDFEVILPENGTYWLVLEGDSNSTSTDYSFQIVTPETEVTAISFGETITGTNSEIGEEDIYQFEGNAGDAIWFDGISSTSSFLSNLEIYTPSGERIVRTGTDDDEGFINLQETGLYSVIVSSSDVIEDYSFRILDVGDAININLEETINGTLSPGESTQIYSIEGTAGQKLFIDNTNISNRFAGSWNLYSPGNEQLIRNSSIGDDFEVALPDDGTYHLVLSGNDDEDINFTFQVNDLSAVEVDANGFGVINSALIAANETDTYTLTGTAGKRVIFDGLLSTDSRIQATLTTPNGIEILRSQSLNINSEALILPESGDYTLTVEGGTNDGEYSFQVLDLNASASVDVDTSNTANFTQGLETQLYQFEGTKGTRLFFDSQSSVSGRWNLLHPGSGQVLDIDQSLSRNFEAVLPADGTYTLAIDNFDDVAFDFDYQIITPEDSISELNFGEVVTNSLGEVGEIDSYTFTGTAGQKIWLDGLTADSDNIEARLISPTGNKLFGDSTRVISPTDEAFSTGNRQIADDTGTITLTEDGIYSLKVSGGDATGNYSFRLLDVDTAEALTAENIKGMIDSANGSEVFRLQDGMAGQTISFTPNGLFSDAVQASNDTLLLSTSQGGAEDGYLGLDSALNLPFREGAAINLVLITDEDRDITNADLNYDNILAAITNQNALLNTVVSANFEDSNGNITLGVDANNTAYIADANGGFNTTTIGNIDSFGTTAEDYVDLSLATGGASWDLNQLRDGGLTATSFTEAFVNIKAEEVSQQLAIEVIASDPDVDFSNLTGEVSGVASGETASFEIDLSVDEKIRSFDLSFVRPGTNTVIGSIPVVVNEVYNYNAIATDADGDTLTYSLIDAPTGADINPQTGEILWDEAEPGIYDFTVQVDDGNGGTATQTYQLEVTGVENDGLGSISGTKWEDLNQDGSRDADESGLAGVSVYLDINNNGIQDDIEPTRVTATDDPSTSDIDETGNYSFNNLLPDTYSVREDVPRGFEQTFPQIITAQDFYTVELEAGEAIADIDFGNVFTGIDNEPPVINSNPVLTTTPGASYRYDVIASDPDGDNLTYSLITSLEGMEIDESGVVTWSPNEVGSFAVEIQVNDGLGGIVNQAYEINVVAVGEDTEAPTVNLGFSSSVIELGSSLNVQVQANDNVGIDTLNVSLNDTSLPLSPNNPNQLNTASITLNEPGVFELEAIATDAAGNIGTKTQSIRVIDTSDTEAPFIELDTSIVDPSDQVIRTPSDLIGTVTDENLEFYRVELAPTNLIDLDNPAELDPDYTLLAEGNSNQVNTALAEIDPSLFRNDSYYIRVYAQDFSGNINVQGLLLGIDTPTKPGEFSQEFIDLSIPLTGVPIEVSRDYSSLDANVQGDFGFGWSLGVSDAQIQESVPVSDAELQGISALFGGSDPFVFGSRVTLNTPDGRRVGFTFEPEPRVGLLGTIWQPRFTPDPGVFDTLEVDNISLTLKSDGTFGLYLFGLPYNPRDYQLTTRDGTAYNYDQFDGLETIEDRNGNTLTYGDNGITSSTGASIEFVRDGEGRIEEIVDPEGESIVYDYDNNGDLVGITDREENETTLKYEDERPHYLTEIEDSLGRRGTRVEYDDNGQISKIIDADGNAIDINFSGVADAQTLTDPEGNTFQLFYDERGNVRTQIDPLNGRTIRTYDGDNNILTETDPEGNKTTFTYDGNGNVLTQTDDLDNTTTFTYNQFSQVLTTKDARDFTTTNIYDDNGNLRSTEDAERNITTFDYDELGNLEEVTDASDNVTGYEYDALGRVMKIIDGEEGETTFTYDNNGNVTSITTPREFTTTFGYDNENRLTTITDADNQTSTIEYNDAGQREATVDALERRTEFEYNDRALLEKIIYPDETEETFQYNTLDQQVATTDRNGNTTQFQYDPLDRLIGVVDAMNNQTIYNLDLNGNIIEQIDAEEHSTLFTYDDLNRLLTTELPLNQTFTNSYDKVGNLTQTNDFNGDVLNYDYDGLGQLTQISLSDETPLETFGYTPTGQIDTIQDERGETTFTYDGLDRLMQRTDPDETFISYLYDADGNVTSLTTPSGTVNYDYDALGRLDLVTDRDGAETDYDYDAVGNLTQTAFDNGVVETRTYDVNDRVEQLTTTDGDGNVLASYAYTFDNVGNRVTETDSTGRVSTYTYDDLYRVTNIAVTDPTLGDETTIYAYDDVGNIQTKTDSNGTTTYTYDDNDRLFQEVTGDQTTTYTYDDVGNLIEKSINGIIVEVYDWNIQGELATAIITENGETTNVAYEYNTDGIRVSQTVDGAETRFLIDANQQEFAQVIEEYTSGGIIQVTYTHGNDLISQTRGDEKGFYHTDSLGSVRLLTNTSGSVANTYLYDPYGAVINQQELQENSYKFTGEQFDSELEGYYQRARYYNPAIGGFISRDSFVGFNNRPLSLNDYLYAEGNPINAIDPSGEATAVEYIALGVGGVTLAACLANPNLIGRTTQQVLTVVDFYTVVFAGLLAAASPGLVTAISIGFAGGNLACSAIRAGESLRRSVRRRSPI